MRKKVLIISYYWPPYGGGGCQRWLKMVKYIRDFGWEPIVYTAEQREIPTEDRSLLEEVPKDILTLRQAIWEPYSLYRKWMGFKQSSPHSGFLQAEEASGFKTAVSMFIRRNFFIPDARRFWVEPSYRYLNQWLNKNHCDAMISTGPPHSMHLIANKLKKQHGLPWLADFRDPWTQIDYAGQLNMRGIAKRYNEALERKVLKKADRVVSVSPSWSESLSKIGKRTVDTVYNGYDPHDFISDDQPDIARFSLVHIGAMKTDRSLSTLWAVLSDLCRKNAHFRSDLSIEFYGYTDKAVIAELKSNRLSDQVLQNNFVGHAELMKLLKTKFALLLSQNRSANVQGVIPGKTYEYLASRRPILAVGQPGSDLDEVLALNQRAGLIHFDDYEGTKKAVERLYRAFKSGQTNDQVAPEERFSRENQCAQICSMLNEMCKQGRS